MKMFKYVSVLLLTGLFAACSNQQQPAEEPAAPETLAPAKIEVKPVEGRLIFLGFFPKIISQLFVLHNFHNYL